MGQKYVSNLPTGFAASPPPDDGSTVAANKVTYATLKTKLGDPLNNWAISENAALLNAFDTSASTVTGTYLTVASDNARVLQCSGTFVLSLGDAATLGTGWFATVKVISGVVTIGRATVGNTIDGVAANLTMRAGQTAVLSVNQAGNGFNSLDNNPLLFDTTDITKSGTFDLSGLPTATGVALKWPTLLGTIALTSDPSGVPALPRDFISGFGLTTSSTTTYDIAAGQAIDSTNSTSINGSAIAAKNQNSWVAGATAGGKLHAAAMASNTWYYWFALWKTADATVDYGFDVSQTPTLPSGYSKYRYLGARKTQAASTSWETFIQHGDEVFWSTPPTLDVNTNNPGTSAVTATLNVPPLKVKAQFNYKLTDIDTIGVSVATVIFTALELTDVTPSNSVSPLAQGSAQGNPTAGQGTFVHPGVWTNTASQIRYRLIGSSGNISIGIVATGWIDPRGKPV